MKKLILFILMGLGFAVPGEILNQIVARHDLRAFGATLRSYAILLLIGFFVAKGIRFVFGRRVIGEVIFYLFFGCLGLSVEWFLLGNAPVLDPLQAITQPGMFTYWGTMLLAPWLLLQPEFAAMKRSFTTFFILFSALYLLVALIVPKAKGGIFFGFVLFAAGTTALNYYYINYFRRVRTSRNDPTSKSLG